MDKELEIQAALTRQLFSAGRFSQVASIVLAALLAFLQRNVIDPEVILAWGVMIVLAALLRTAIIRAYRRSETNGDSATHSWLIRFRLGVLVSGMTWGAASYLLYPANDPQHQLLLFFMLTGLTAGAFVSLSADIASAVIFNISVILPLIVRMFITGDNFSVAVSMLYFGFMIMNLKGINRNVIENVALRHEAAEREKEAKLSEQRYRLLLNHSPVGILHYDSSLVITYCNDRLADMLHTSAGLLNGVEICALKDQSILPAMKKALDGILGYYEGHYSATFSDVHRWAEVTCAPSRDSEGMIVGGVAIIQDITERKQAETHIHSLAFYDSLTNVPNRRLFYDRLDQALAVSKRNSCHGALIFLDLDNFKPVNDIYGHSTGDSLLIEAARRIGSCIRQTDTVARFGGDEFIVLLSELKEDEAESTAGAGVVAEKIRRAMSEPYRLVVKQDGNAETVIEHQCTSSIGVAVFDHHFGRDEILKRADMAMYEAKNAGRNCVRFSDQGGSNRPGMENMSPIILHQEWCNS